jgi:hypothetical protein
MFQRLITITFIGHLIMSRLGYVIRNRASQISKKNLSQKSRIVRSKQVALSYLSKKMDQRNF